MKFTRETVGRDDRLVRSYAPGRIVTSHETLETSAVLARDRVISGWRPRRAAEISVEDLEVVWTLRPEVLLLGSGARLEFPPPAVVAACAARGLGLEVMDTAAACRTFNVLASEGRQVVAVLLML